MGALRRLQNLKKKEEEQAEKDQRQWMGVEDTGWQWLLERYMSNKWSLYTVLLLGGIMVNRSLGIRTLWVINEALLDTRIKAGYLSP